MSRRLYNPRSRATVSRMNATLWLMALLCLPGLLRADGGAILAKQTVNGLDLTVFASPMPLRAGPVDISVLVQKENAPAALLDANVEIAWSSVASTSPDWMPPCCSMDKNTDKIPATRGHSQNKFLYSAIVPVKSSGASELVIRVTRNGEEALLSCDVQAGPPRAPALAYWPWLAFPPVAILGFALNQKLGRRKKT